MIWTAYSRRHRHVIAYHVGDAGVRSATAIYALAKAAVGEDTYVRCTTCDYAANVEAVEVRAPEAQEYADAPAAHVEDTPDTPTIETLVNALNADHPRADGRAWTAADTLKNVIVMLAHPDGTRTPLAIGVPGDRARRQRAVRVSSAASGRQARRTGAYGEVPSPAQTWSHAAAPGAWLLGADPAPGHHRDTPDTRPVSRSQFVTSAPWNGTHSCPPWVCPARTRSTSAKSAAVNRRAVCVSS